MNIINTFLEHYGWEGAALLTSLITLLLVQLYYYLFIYGAIPSYMNNRRTLILAQEPSISVVIPMFNENYSFIEERLPLLLAQEYSHFEIVLVYIGHDNDFYEDLKLLKHSFPQIVTTKIHLDPRYPISRKMALNIGVKSAHSEHIIFSSTEVAPSTNRWISLMAKGFMRGDIVLGYSGIMVEPGYNNYMMRTWNMMHSINWIARAIRHRPYRGSLHALGLTKSIYFGAKGFNFLNMNIGEDDLFMQEVMKSDNVSIILSSRAIVREKVWGGFSAWINRLRYYGSSSTYYKSDVKGYLGWEARSRTLFFITTLCTMIFMPIEFKLLALLLLILRYIIVTVSVMRISNRLGEKQIAKYYFIYDVLSPLYSGLLWIFSRRRDPRVWR